MKLIFILLFLFLGKFSFTQDKNDSVSVFFQDARVDSLIKKQIQLNEINPKISGFRIQLFCGNRSSSYLIKQKFLDIFKEEGAYVTYETPCFKVQVGNYRTKLEAEKKITEVKKYFNTAFIVQREIIPPKIN